MKLVLLLAVLVSGAAAQLTRIPRIPVTLVWRSESPRLGTANRIGSQPTNLSAEQSHNDGPFNVIGKGSNPAIKRAATDTLVITDPASSFGPIVDTSGPPGSSVDSQSGSSTLPASTLAATPGRSNSGLSTGASTPGVVTPTSSSQSSSSSSSASPTPYIPIVSAKKKNLAGPIAARRARWSPARIFAGGLDDVEKEASPQPFSAAHHPAPTLELWRRRNKRAAARRREWVSYSKKPGNDRNWPIRLPFRPTPPT
ncbi:hypothetical protein B0H14DRAFT_3150906 [Mycena olivaceomarginata]|nr:hypothetical protein B0H14DRAFT_3150906 [Mycena olivaceomarginata]